METVSVVLTWLLSCAKYDEEKQHKLLSNRVGSLVIMASLWNRSINKHESYCDWFLLLDILGKYDVANSAASL